MGDLTKNSRWNNIKAQLTDGSVRLRYCSGLVIMVSAASIGYAMLRHTVSTAPVEPSQFATAPDMASLEEPLPLSKMPAATPVYDGLLADQNAATAAAAKQTGESALPVIRPQAATKPTSDADAQPIAEPLAFAVIKSGLSQITALQSSQERERWQQSIAAKTAAMRNQANLLIAAWQPKEHASSTMLASQAANPKDLNREQITASSVQVKPAPAQIALRAGEISYAVLDTAVNSDEPGPVTATIVQGALNGTKLLGKIEMGQNAQKAGLHFTLASVPAQRNSIAIDAWAIDPETARTAIASEINQHYLVRYGTFFAASFLGGFSEALLKGGQRQQLINSPFGTTVQSDPYTTQQLVLAGAGNIGKQVAHSLGGLINRPATITINAGIGIGVLFMTDVGPVPN